MAFLIGGITGRAGVTLGTSSAIAVGGYLLHTLSATQHRLDSLRWASPWHWYTEGAMLLHGLGPELLLEFGMAIVGLAIGWWAFLRPDLRNP